MATTDEIRANAYVGFDTITQQIEHKLLKRGFQFNVIVVGQFAVFVGMRISSTEFRSNGTGKVDYD
jgi:hypothetical protein